jgi:hypothetical protein
MGSKPNRWRLLVRPERLVLYTRGKSPPGQAAFPQSPPLLFVSARPVGCPLAAEAALWGGLLDPVKRPPPSPDATLAARSAAS